MDLDFIVFVINFIFSVIYVMLVARALLPWLPPSRVFRPIYKITDPVLRVIRIGLPPAKIGMDVSPFIVLILVWIVHQLILKAIS